MQNCGAGAESCLLSETIVPGPCFLLQCPVKRNESGNKCYGWYFCGVCIKRVDRKNLNGHFSSGRHNRRAGVSSLPLPRDVGTNNEAGSHTNKSHGDHHEASLGLQKTNEESNVKHAMMSRPEVYDYGSIIEESHQRAHTPRGSLNHADTHIDNQNTYVDNPNSAVGIVTASSVSIGTFAEQVYSSAPAASVMDLSIIYQDQIAMKLFQAAEFLQDGGGIRYLVGRAFRQTEYLSDSSMLPSLEEAKWQFQNFIQYISSGEMHRKRQANILAPFALTSTLFQATEILPYKKLNRYYGRSNRHTIWNTLPIPTVENVNGIAYVGVVNLIRYLLSFKDTEVDPFVIRFSDDPDEITMPDRNDHTVVVQHIAQSMVSQRWKQELLRASKEHLGDEFQFDNALMLWAVDWRDGFGANRTKQNRKSTNAWTFSLSTPRNRINSLSNTLPIALGLKKNPNWPEVEHRFLEESAKLGDGLTPIMVYQAHCKKVVPVFVKRIACLTDKVERADYTSTLSCTSKYHRCFGKLIRLDPPTFKTDEIAGHLRESQLGNKDLSLKQYGWSCDFVNRTSNGGRFPACYDCRKKTVDWLRKPDYAKLPSDKCSVCANWTLSESTKALLAFSAPKDYPTTQRSLPNCPVQPPCEREVGLDKLPHIDLTFPVMIQATKFAFFHSSSGRSSGWTKAMCKAYLRVCGLNGKQSDLLYAAAGAAHRNQTPVNYDLHDRIGDFLFPAAWIGDMPMHLFIEMLMHLLFLGVAESDYVLFNLYMQSTKRPAETFRKTIQELLKVLVRFNLSWLLVLPFSGMTKAKLSTGTWVSENWLAYVRIQKFVYSYSVRRGKTDERVGSNDLVRAVCSFSALVARVLSHSGVSQRTVIQTRMYVKEFLSCIRELDVRTRYKQMHEMASASSNRADDGDGPTSGNDKSKDQWWLKSNYISCLNLPETMERLGPLPNFWDGGGKGERYIQEIKPHIPRGVRDGGVFFAKLLEKVYKVNCMHRIEGTPEDITLTMEGTTNAIQSIPDDQESDLSVAESSTLQIEDQSRNNANESLTGVPPTTVTVDEQHNDLEDDDELSYDGDPDEEEAEKQLLDEEDEKWSTPMESEQMKKARTYYIYKNKALLEESINKHEPVSGILVSDGPTGIPTMYLVHRDRGKSFGCVKVSFLDNEGIHMCGLWYAPVAFEDTELPAPITNREDITNIAKSATIAIPLRYTLGDTNENSMKYCVLTNWWKERNQNGKYQLPTLPVILYEGMSSTPATNTG